MRRYYVIASAKGHTKAYLKGLVQGVMRTIRANGRHPIGNATFESFTKLSQIELKLREAQREYRLERVVFIDLGKNVLPYWLAAEKLGIEIVAIADQRLAETNKRYRGIDIVEDRAALAMEFDAAIVSNLSPVHSANRREEWRRMTDRPVIDLFEVADGVATAPQD
jgi:hypothetical protein